MVTGAMYALFVIRHLHEMIVSSHRLFYQVGIGGFQGKRRLVVNLMTVCHAHGTAAVPWFEDFDSKSSYALI